METYYNTLQDFYELGQMYLTYMVKRINPTNYDKCFGKDAIKPVWMFTPIAYFDDDYSQNFSHSYINHSKVIGYIVDNGVTRQIEFGNVIKIAYYAGKIEVGHSVTPEQLSTLYKIAFESLKKKVMSTVIDDIMEDSIERDRIIEGIKPGRENNDFTPNIREDELKNYITKEDYSNLGVNPWTFSAKLDNEYFESLRIKDEQLPKEQPSPRIIDKLNESDVDDSEWGI